VLFLRENEEKGSGVASNKFFFHNEKILEFFSELDWLGSSRIDIRTSKK
jgi:hypothetical protein